MKTQKEEYKVLKKHYIIPLVLCLLILVAGIIMTVLGQTDYGVREDVLENKYNEVTGPGVIAIGIVFLIFVLIYIRSLYKENRKLNRRQ